MGKVSDKEKLSFFLFALNPDYYEDKTCIRAGGREYHFDHMDYLSEIIPVERDGAEE